MAQMVVHHRVEDFAKWKQIFDEHAAERAKSGSKGYRLLRAVDNPNELLIIFDWDTQERAQSFSQSDSLKDAMMRAGVISKPHVHFWEEIEARNEGEAQGRWERTA